MPHRVITTQVIALDSSHVQVAALQDDTRYARILSSVDCYVGTDSAIDSDTGIKFKANIPEEINLAGLGRVWFNGATGVVYFTELGTE